MGRTKTRLAREIGLAPATRFARVCALTTIARLARDTRWRTLLAITPDAAAGSAIWPARSARAGQGRGDIGARMARLLSSARRPALLIGADIPGVSRSLIAGAFHLLRRSEAVLGPAEDGGFWLIGFNRRAPSRGLFAGVRWSSAHALADTVASLHGTRIAYAARLGDVDDAHSHRRLGALAGRVIPPAPSRAAW